MKKDIEIVSSSERFYISDITKFDEVKLTKVGNDFRRLCLISYPICFRNDDYRFYCDFKCNEKNKAFNYYYQIKKVLKQKMKIKK